MRRGWMTPMAVMAPALAAGVMVAPATAVAAVAGALPDLTGHWVGFAALGVFALAYALVIAEEATHLRKSKPVVAAAGILWLMVALAHGSQGFSAEVVASLRHVFLEYAELMLFLLVAMTYVNTLEERRVFDALRAWLVRSGFSYRALFWLTGILAFFISPVADNMTTALVMCAVVLAVGRDSPRFVAMSCISIVVAANAGGAFSPFGDITTLMVWQKGVVRFEEFFVLFVPSVINFIVPAGLMHFALPTGTPPARDETVTMKPGALAILGLFILTIATAISFHNFLHLPPVIGMMTGFSYLQIYCYFLRRGERRRGGKGLDIFSRVAAVEWDTLLFFYGVMMCVGALGTIGYLATVSSTLYGEWGPTAANVMIGVLSAVFDNIPLMFAVLTMQPEMSHGQWLLITLTTGVGGSLLSIGSAAGVALMGQARGAYTFASHLRWSWAVALGYGASVVAHRLLNAALF